MLYWPGRVHWSEGHGMHVAWTLALFEVEYFPVVHGRHEEEDWAPFRAEYVPLGHAVQNSELKALIASPELKLDMYQKSTATIEGTATIAKMRLDNNSHLNAPYLVIGTLEVDTDSYAKCEINVSSAITIAAGGKSQIELWGEQKITIKKFTNSSTLYKKDK